MDRGSGAYAFPGGLKTTPNSRNGQKTVAIRIFCGIIYTASIIVPWRVGIRPLFFLTIFDYVTRQVHYE